MISRLYTTAEVAKILQVTQRTIYEYIYSGKLKAVKIGQYWRITEENLNAFINGDK